MVSNKHSLSLAVFYRLIYTLDNFFPFIAYVTIYWEIKQIIFFHIVSVKNSSGSFSRQFIFVAIFKNIFTNFYNKSIHRQYFKRNWLPGT